ncbi:MAG TPA: cysteine synthase family protein [Planctomycetota bacterium]|nr:cysteine synthase family protein [Planctomycetota bacterium]
MSALASFPSAAARLASLVGNTPLLRIDYRLDGRARRVFAKYESMNFTGSVKDRMALFILERAYAEGALRPGQTIVEASSGNTGIAFAALGRALGHRVVIAMPDWMSVERRRLLQSFGAEVLDVSRAAGGFVGAVRLAAEFAEREGAFAPAQFANEANVAAHEQSTGPELERQLAAFGATADAFVAGVGTGGTVMGVGRFLRRTGRRVRVHPLEPASSPTLRTGHCVGRHRIQGISDEFIPAIVKLADLDAVVDVHDGDAILMAQALASRLGLGVGISSGANLLGAMQVLEQHGGDAVVATVFPDSNKKYLSTDLCGCEPVAPGYLTPRVELTGFTAVR